MRERSVPAQSAESPASPKALWSRPPPNKKGESAPGLPLPEPSAGRTALRAYLLENWNRFRAPGRPYFFLSLTRASLVRCPARFSVVRSSGFSICSALAIPYLSESAWDAGPPPVTLTSTSTLCRFPVRTSGCTAGGRGCCSLGGRAGAGVDFQLRDQPAPQAGFREHAAHRPLDEPFGMPRGEHLRRRGLLQPPDVPRVPGVRLVGHLLAGQVHLIRVDDDDEIADVGVVRKRGLVLPAQHRRPPGGEPAEYLILRVHHVPGLVCVLVRKKVRRFHAPLAFPFPFKK